MSFELKIILFDLILFGSHIQCVRKILQLQEAEENEYRNSFRAPVRDDSNSAGSENDSGFVVKGAPWEQKPKTAPNTASVEDFPQIAGSNHVPAATPDGAWGMKR